jgi:hypothetical protein
MQFRITIVGNSPIIMHDVNGTMDTTSEANREKSAITSKRGGRTESEEARLRELETLTSLWFTFRNEFGIPERALRSMVEASARTRKQGAEVRQGLRVVQSDFHYDQDRYGVTPEELSKTAQFTVPVRVQRNTINRTRAKIDPPWSCVFVVDVAEELVDRSRLTNWLEVAGRRIGIGDWRPATSGSYGTFDLVEIEDAC